MYKRRRSSPPSPENPSLAILMRQGCSAVYCSARARGSLVLRVPLEPAPDLQKPRADVIDLGAPRSRRARRPYTPNPRLYPGPQARAGARPGRKHPPAARPARPPPRPARAPRPAPAPRHGPAPRRRLRARRPAPRTLPSARLYRPPPPRARPPPAPPRHAPRAAWPPPAPSRALDTASRAALRLAARRDSTPGNTQRCPRSPSPEPRNPLSPPVWSRDLVVTLSAAGDAGARRFRPAPAGPPLLRSLDTDSGSSTLRPAPPRAGMAAPPRHSASPEDRSDGNDPLSAPSEYLAEFLSAIMQRQYAEALKYCRLILQYEPHNATARGFYPLLRQKLGLARGRSGRAPPRGSDSEDASRHSAAPPRDEEVMSHSADESGSEGSCASQSSLSLDSSERSGSGSGSGGRTAASASAGSSSSARWPSDGASDEPDDNGNTPAPAPPVVTLAPRTPRPDDVENDNAGGGDHTARLKSESAASLRRLRAQFTCEIK